MEIVPPSTPLARRIVGIAEGLRAEPTDGLVDALVKLTMLFMFMTLALIAGLYEKGLLPGAKPEVAPDVAPERVCVAAGAKRRGSRTVFGQAAAVEIAGHAGTDEAVAAETPGVAADPQQMARPMPRAGVTGWRPRAMHGGLSPGSASKSRDVGGDKHAHFVSISKRMPLQSARGSGGGWPSSSVRAQRSTRSSR